MAEELQSLLEKINQEGLKKAEAQKNKIIADARAEAEQIIADARIQAAAVKNAAESEAAETIERAGNAVRQAARDLMLELKHELESRLNDAVSGATKAALTPELMAEIVKMLADRFISDPDSEISVMCAVKDTASLDAALKASLAGSLKKSPVILANAGISGGIEVNVGSDELFFDFSQEALTGVVASYIGGKLAAIFAKN